MKKILLLIFALNLTSCQSQTDKNYANVFKNCLTNTDIDLLNKATHNFEKLLIEHYESDDTNANFKKYLNEISSNQSVTRFSADFYLNSNSIHIVSEMEENGTFDKIWIEFDENQEDLEEEIPITTHPGYKEPKEEEIEIYILNTNGLFLECVNENSTNKEINEVLNSLSKYGDISPSIPASAINEIMNKNDFNNEINKVIVTIGFYYNMVNLLNRNP